MGCYQLQPRTFHGHPDPGRCTGRVHHRDRAMYRGVRPLHCGKKEDQYHAYDRKERHPEPKSANLHGRITMTAS